MGSYGSSWTSGEGERHHDLKLLPDYGSGSFRLVGWVRNHSPWYAITELDLRLSMKDCFVARPCAIVGETNAHLFFYVPAGQSRAIDHHVSFTDLGPSQGSRSWEYAITEVLGR